MVQSLHDNVNLDRVGRLHGLHDCIEISSTNRQAISLRMMATTVEAIIGAVFLDGGSAAVHALLDTLNLRAMVTLKFLIQLLLLQWQLMQLTWLSYSAPTRGRFGTGTGGIPWSLARGDLELPRSRSYTQPLSKLPLSLRIRAGSREV